MTINKGMVDKIVVVAMVNEFHEEAEQQDAVLEEIDNRKMHCCNCNGLEMITKHKFLCQVLKAQLPNNAVASDYFNLFLTDDFFYLLVEQTDLYPAQYRRNNPNLPHNSRANMWVETTQS